MYAFSNFFVANNLAYLKMQMNFFIKTRLAIPYGLLRGVSSFCFARFGDIIPGYAEEEYAIGK